MKTQKLKNNKPVLMWFFYYVHQRNVIRKLLVNQVDLISCGDTMYKTVSTISLANVNQTHSCVPTINYYISHLL